MLQMSPHERFCGGGKTTVDQSLQEFCQCLEVIRQLGSMTAAAGFPWGRPDKFPM